MQSPGFRWHLFGLGWERFSFIERAPAEVKKHEIYIYPWESPGFEF